MRPHITPTVIIPGGWFEMGDVAGNSNEQPAIRVYVAPFRLDIYPVTNAQFSEFLLDNPEWRKENVRPDQAEDTYLSLWRGAEYPADLNKYAVINVSWHAATAYASWAGKRLPTEAEWEFAAGGPNHTRYALGDSFDPTDYVFALAGDPIGFPVAKHRPNGFGCYDMSGGVWEWTLDYYDVHAYTWLRADEPVNTRPADRRTLRGGAYTFDNPHYLRCAARGSNAPVAAHEDYGFRCAAAA